MAVKEHGKECRPCVRRRCYAPMLPFGESVTERVKTDSPDGAVNTLDGSESSGLAPELIRICFGGVTTEHSKLPRRPGACRRSRASSG